MATLSERVINANNDIVKQIQNSDYVQKVLLTGDVSGANKAVFQRILAIAKQVKTITEKTMPKVLGIPGLKPEEKAFFEKLISEMPAKTDQYIQEFEAAVGPVPDSVLSPDIAKSVEERVQRFNDLIAKGSVVHLLAVSLPGYVIPVALQNYLASNPSYKDNVYTNLALRKSLGMDRTVEVMKGFLNSRAGEVDATVEAELTGLYRRVAETQLKASEKIYSGN